MSKRIKILSDDAGKRLDIILSEHLRDTTRSQIKKWIEAGNVSGILHFVQDDNGLERHCVQDDNDLERHPEQSEGSRKYTIFTRSSYKVKEGDIIEIKLEPPKQLSAKPQNIPIKIIYEDADIVVVNKSPDMVVHPAAGNLDGTLVNALLYHCKDLSGIGGVLRPGIVHRLDKGTSGAIIIAKNDAAHASLSKQFKDRGVKKIYHALVYGSPKKDSGTFTEEIGRHPTDRKKMSTKSRNSRTAVTHWKVMKRYGKELTLVEVGLETGRTHQIRVHFSANGMPLVGDETYGGKKTIKRIIDDKIRHIIERAGRPMLHSWSLAVTHPRTGVLENFKAELPKDFKTILEDLSVFEE